MTDALTDSTTVEMDLLRKYEPVVRYTHGELFYPCAVDEYVRRCSLWERLPDGTMMLRALQGNLTLDRLATFRSATAGHAHFLRFVQEPIGVADYQHWRNRPERPIFHAPGRLARVGLLSRIIDSLFDLSLLVRGRVPGGTTAVAHKQFCEMQKADARRVYYARVLREGGYIILHYMFFYPMNDWRSSFYGVNDHESDWEQIFVYLADDDNDEPAPRWVAYASHDFTGDDLRRRWDDPDLHRVGNHPVVYSGAGSHASYFLPGEYVMATEPSALRPLKNALRLINKWWREKLRQGMQETDPARNLTAGFSIPFVDYARGDGLCIGPGQQEEWQPELISDDVPWVANYRGLWGLDTEDPFGGERAPSGPKFNRDGTVRMAWYAPLAWAGLDKTPPPKQYVADLEREIERMVQEQVEVDAAIDHKRQSVRQLALQVDALRSSEYVTKLAEARVAMLKTAQDELQALYIQQLSLQETLSLSRDHLTKVRRGNWGEPQAHIRHNHLPVSPVTGVSRAVEFWAAISGGVFLAAIVALMVLRPSNAILWFVLFGVVFLGVEQALHGRLDSYLLNVTIILAFVTSAILIWHYWWLILIVAIIALVIFMIRENLRELAINVDRQS
jgi:hypothetical protein